MVNLKLTDKFKHTKWFKCEALTVKQFIIKSAMELNSYSATEQHTEIKSNNLLDDEICLCYYIKYEGERAKYEVTEEIYDLFKSIKKEYKDNFNSLYDGYSGNNVEFYKGTALFNESFYNLKMREIRQ